MGYYPIFLDLRGRPCLVVGGGKIGTRKAEGLLKAGASVTVVSPAVDQTLRGFIDGGRMRHIERPYRDGDLMGYFLAYAATGDPEVDAAMAVEARREGVLLNTADRPALCDFITPAVVERGDLAIAVSTQGKCPGFAQRVRQKIASILGPEFGAALELAAERRKALLASDAALPWELRRQRQERMLSQTWPEESEAQTQP